MCIHRKYIYLSTFVYLMVPLCLFLLSWLHVYYGAFCAAVLLFCMCKVFRSIQKTAAASSLCIGRYHIFYLLLILLFLLSTGHGGFIGANGVDTPWRDAIYHDLVTYPWPVIYRYSDTMLAYYLAYWLPAAGISWLCGLGIWGSHVILFIWTYLGLGLIFLLLCEYLQPSRKQVLLVCMIFLLWSGLNLFGMLLRSLFSAEAFRIDDNPGFLSWLYSAHSYDGYFIGYFLRTTFDSVANVYNQYIPVALVTLLFLQLRHMYGIYAFLGLLALPYSPLGFAGVAFLMLGDGVNQTIHDIRQKQSLVWQLGKEYASLENLLPSVTILPIFYFYFMMNSMSQRAVDTGIWAAPLSAYGLFRIGHLLLFYVLAFGIYLFLLHKKHKSDFLYRWVGGVLLLLPFFRIGMTGDFLWNASMAPYIVIMTFVMKQVLSAWDRKCFWGRDLILVMCLAVSAITPLMQMTTSLRACILQKKLSVYIDEPGINGTFADKKIDNLQNFLAKDYQNSIFYRYLSRRQ